MFEGSENSGIEFITLFGLRLRRQPMTSLPVQANHDEAKEEKLSRLDSISIAASKITKINFSYSDFTL